jgi:hypothetical protein
MPDEFLLGKIAKGQLVGVPAVDVVHVVKDDRDAIKAAGNTNT